MTIDLRGCRRHCVVPQTMPSGLSPLHDSQSARGFPTSVRSGRQKRRGGRVVKASSSRDEYGLGAGGPSMVDADMIVLRKRVYELQLQENKYEPPQEWMQWEKKWHGKYRSSVYQAMECLQFNLINTRPAVSMALLSLVSLSVPASVVVVLITCAAHLGALTGNGHL